MANRKASERDAGELGRVLAIGQKWISVSRRLESQDPTSQVTIKSFSLRVSLASDSEWGTRYFIVLRAKFGNRDLVKFRRLGKVENLGHVLEEMMRKESDWRDDKFGSDSNL